MKNSKTIRNQIVVASPVGKLRLIASDKGLVAIDVRNVRVASDFATSAMRFVAGLSISIMMVVVMTQVCQVFDKGYIHFGEEQQNNS